MLKELQSLGLDIVVQDKEGNAVDMRQEFDDDDSSFDGDSAITTWAMSRSKASCRMSTAS